MFASYIHIKKEPRSLHSVIKIFIVQNVCHLSAIEKHTSFFQKILYNEGPILKGL